MLFSWPFWRTLPITKQEPCSFYLPRLVRPDKYRILHFICLDILVHWANSTISWKEINSVSTVWIRTGWVAKIHIYFTTILLFFRYFRCEYMNILKVYQVDFCVCLNKKPQQLLDGFPWIFWFMTKETWHFICSVPYFFQRKELICIRPICKLIGKFQELRRIN